MKRSLVSSVVLVLAAGCSGPPDGVDVAQIDQRVAAVSKGGLGRPTRHNFVGFYHPATSVWTLRMQRPGFTADTAPDFSFGYGNVGNIPVVGDWNGDGTETQGVFQQGWWYLSNTLGNSYSDLSFAYGNSTDVPIVGDWDGNGTTTQGVFRQGWWYLSNTLGHGSSDVSFAFGNSDDVPLAGDWDGDGVDTVGVYRPSTGEFFLTNSPTAATLDIHSYFGNQHDQPIVGDWDGDGVTSYGVKDGTNWFLANDLHTGVGDVSVSGFGATGDVPISGDWNVNAPRGYSVAPASLSSFFLLGVYEQPSRNFANWRNNRGINTMVGLSTSDTIPDWTQTAVGFNPPLKMIRDPAGDYTNPNPNVIAWQIEDEPDLNVPTTIIPNSQPPTTYLSAIQAKYNAVRSLSSLPIYMDFAEDHLYSAVPNLLPGVPDTCAGLGDYAGTNTDCYPSYFQYSDWISHDFYPVNWTTPVSWDDSGLNVPARTVDKVTRWTSKPQLVFVETTPHIYSPTAPGPTPDQLRAEVWLAIIHGARGLVYFSYNWSAADCNTKLCPDGHMNYGWNPGTCSAWCPDGTPSNVASEIATQNARITALAPVLQSAINPAALGFSGVPITGGGPSLDATWRQYGGKSYFIVLNPGTSTVSGTMHAYGLPAGTTTFNVVGESRTVPVSNGLFADSFGPSIVHIYSTP